MINSVMNRLQDFTFFSQLMANANMGWWKANLSTANYECSDFIVELLGLDQTGVISFEDFNKRIQKEEQHSATFHSFGVYQWPEVVYLLDTVKGSVWVRSKVCFQETDEDGNEVSMVYPKCKMVLIWHLLTKLCNTVSVSYLTFSSICLLVSNYTIWMGYWWI